MNASNSHTDTELIAALIEGHEWAFATIYERHAFALYRYARKNISDDDDCKEIIQDIFESLWKRHAELHHITVLDAYLYRTVKYKIIRYTQHQAVKRRYAEHFQLFEVMYDSIPEAEEHVPENIEAMIERFVSELPERCQQAFTLRLKENLSNKEIARRMNITNAAVRNYISMAIGHLRASYQKLYRLG